MIRYIIYGPTPKEVLHKYTIITGKANQVPSWSYGLWLSTSFTTSYDEKTVNSFLEGMSGRDIPVEVFHFDCFWMKAFHWCDFEFDTEMFPDPKSQITRLKEGGESYIYIQSMALTESTYKVLSRRCAFGSIRI